jgi:hypothetical protein
VKTREQITATGDFPAAPFLTDDIPARNEAWDSVRSKCHEIAIGRGLEIAENEPAAERSVLYMKTIDKATGAFQVECSRAEATIVRLRLSAWAVPQ